MKPPVSRLDGPLSFARLRAFLRLGALAGLGFAPAHALEIRTYQPSRHDRFLNYPSAPAWNDDAWFPSRKFAGVGWMPIDPTGRQFVLVSPRHVAFAGHFVPGAGTTIRFLNTGGEMIDRTTASSVQILNGSGQPTDMALITLSSAIGSEEGVPPLPYLNLANEAAYLNLPLTIVGWAARAGTAPVSIINNFVTSGLNETRVIRSQYKKSSGGQDDCFFAGGDSGSPTFGMAGTNPALVGVHTAVSENGTHRINIDTFVPHYVGGLNAWMALNGYQMAPVYPPNANIDISTVKTPAKLRKLLPGVLTLNVTNSGTGQAGNPRVIVRFPENCGPTLVTALGWFFDKTGPETWEVHRTGLSPSQTSPITFTWALMPLVNSIPVEITHMADGSGKEIESIDLLVEPSFLAWAGSLVDTDVTHDPDADGIPTLLEYAFGGDPAVASRFAPGGGIMAPQAQVDGSQVILRFPVRTDAVTRGLQYITEFTENQEVYDWSQTTPPGYSSVDEPFFPAREGFVLRTITFNAEATVRLCRVRVVWNEEG